MEFVKNNLARIQSATTITKAKSLPNGQFEAVLSTEDLDRHGERVSIKGLEIPKNQIIKMYYNHETNGENLPIGKWLKVYKKNNQLVGLGEVDLEDEFAVKVYKKIMGGFIDSISIGFYPQEYDGENSTWTKSTLVEASVVAEPANVNAQIFNKDLGFTQAEFKKLLKVKLKDAEEDPELPEETVPVEENVTVKRLSRKGMVTDILTTPKKYELMDDYYDVIYAFEEAFYSPDTDVSQFSTLLNEAIGLLQKVSDGTIDQIEEPTGASGSKVLSEVKSAIDVLNLRQGALEEAMKAANENPAKKNVEKVRFVLKSVGQSVEQANRIIKVTLKETK